MTNRQRAQRRRLAAARRHHRKFWLNHEMFCRLRDDPFALPAWVEHDMTLQHATVLLWLTGGVARIHDIQRALVPGCSAAARQLAAAGLVVGRELPAQGPGAYYWLDYPGRRAVGILIRAGWSLVDAA